MPLSTSGNFADDLNSTAITIDENMEENLSKLNNLSGSYNNLFRESSVNMSTSNDNIDDIVVCNDNSENVYSNITSNNNSVKTNNSKNVVDENIHVYSNINNSNSVAAISTLTASTPITSKKSKKISTSISSTMINNESNLLNDLDLDLDDPVMISSYKNNSHVIGKLPTAVVKEPKLYLNKNPIAAVEMKNVIKTLDASTISAVNSPISPPPNSSSNAFISNLKHLQESTMIDTALDLDSLELDGSSIGNNSQSCLVKTAIV